MKKASYVFIGGGLPSLLFASLLSKLKPSNPIIIIESLNRPGGQFKSIEYPNGAVFDHGMHIYYETEIQEVDEAFLEILPPQNWHYLTENNKDIAGIFFNGKLQTLTPYPDLRSHSLEKRESFIQSLFQNLEKPVPESYSNMSELLNFHFGFRITEEIFEPILKKLYSLSAKELDPLAFRLTAMNRVILFNEQTTEDLMKSEYLRARIGYPDQLKLPIARKSRSRGLYPKVFGFGRIIDALVQNLEKSGVVFLLNTRIKEVVLENSKVKYLSCDDPAETRIEVQNGVIWSADVFGLLKSMGQPVKSNIQFGLKRYVNVLLNSEPKMGGLYYFYNFDEISGIFRVTNYSSYCSGAIKNGTFPLCIEYWIPKETKEEDIVTEVTNDLIKMRIIDSKSKILFAEVSPQPILFPNPSVEALTSIRNAVAILDKKKIKNLILIGPLTSKDTFFLHEVLKSGYKQIKEKGWL